MTEAEWLSGADIEELMLEVWWCPGHKRKYHLFAIACIEPLRHYLSDERLLAALDMIARYAEGGCDERELMGSKGEAEAAHREIQPADELRDLYNLRWCAAGAVVVAGSPSAAEFNPDLISRCVSASALCAEPAQRDSARLQAELRCLSLVREIYGNPFRPVSFAFEWRTTTAVLLASKIYESRDFGAMPILADALQDAGCEDEQVLNHCRDAGATHVRGCWVVDLVLGKE